MKVWWKRKKREEEREERREKREERIEKREERRGEEKVHTCKIPNINEYGVECCLPKK
jgi:hypothetical protein